MYLTMYVVQLSISVGYTFCFFGGVYESEHKEPLIREPLSSSAAAVSPASASRSEGASRFAIFTFTSELEGKSPE